ncbi:unnamed protein product [Sordaria macrospora k-hell]|uniref:WGS project CABT00000000 data, contig 2.14 n=1 Tax=Sordaria macrospora (strain ATCC MYA-333 / DSM 997 / K(L3346) / K-hell) TaxID=771870 RepID=F7VZ27_SORMK|nr:uncharacterized protein SMAC_04389 [Sordaria macrospora k-hell]CCC10774.1 unnamed protein product [Sordaria macrospora k-hell]
MSFRPRPNPRFLNLGFGAGRPRIGPAGSRDQTHELSQFSASTKSRFSTSSSSSTPLPHASPRPRSYQYHHPGRQKQHNHNHSNRSWNQQQQQQTRRNSTNSNSQSNPNGPNPNKNTNKNSERLSRLLTRLPRFLHPYLHSLRSSPSSFIVAFLILHEITAVLPGLGFFYFFHYYDTGHDGSDDEDSEAKTIGRRFESWVMGWMMKHGYSEVIDKKMEGFERWFRRKGYFGFDGGQGKEDGDGKEEGRLNAVEAEGGADGKEGEGEGKEQALMKKWRSGDEKYRVLVDAALAYAITKVLLPVRIIVSVQATPWFSGCWGG